MSNALTDLTTQTPAEVDKAWADAMAPAYKIDADLSATEASIRKYKRANYAVPAYLTERAAKLDAALTEARKAGEPFDAEYTRRGGWSRYLLVANVKGHVHSSDCRCSTLRPTTLVVPMWELSGSSVAAVIDQLGTTACTVCFPNAPVETRESRQRASEAARAAKAAEREAKRREKLAKAAVRAEKLLVKVEKAYADLGGRDAVLALPSHGPGSAYGLTFDLQTTVQDVILDDCKRARGERTYNADPREVIAEAKALGLA